MSQLAFATARRDSCIVWLNAPTDSVRGFAIAAIRCLVAIPLIASMMSRRASRVSASIGSSTECALLISSASVVI